MKPIIYIQNVDEGIEIYSKKQSTMITNKTIVQYMNYICFKTGSSLCDKRNFSKKILNAKNKLPIFVHPCLILFPTMNTRSKECIWINYYYIERVYKDIHEQVHIVFEGGSTLILNISMRSLRVQLKRCKTICEFIEYL